MMNVTLRQMRYFEALARLNHFGQAAEASAVSQPALSMQIKELESELGAALFERGARGVHLTPFGQDVAFKIREILQTVDQLADVVNASKAVGLQRLKLGVIPTIAPYLLPKLIPCLRGSFSGLDLQIRESLTPRLLQELSAGRIDAALLALPVSDPGLKELPLFEEEFVLIRAKSFANEPVPDPEKLKFERLLLLEEGHCFRDQALAVCNMPNATPRDGLEGSSLSTLVQMVGAGLGVTLLPRMAVPVETRSADVVAHQLPGLEPSRTIGLIWRHASPLTDQFRIVAQAICDAAERPFKAQSTLC